MPTPTLAACAALFAAPTPAPLGTPNAAGTCVFVDLDVAARFGYRQPDSGINPAFSLRRARTELAIDHQGWAGVRVALMPVRSGGDTGYIGIDGESIVPRFQIAEARLDWRRVGLRVVGGIIDDPWAITANQAWGDLMGLALPLSTSTGLIDRSDLGGAVSWTAPRNLASVSATWTSGQGADFREQNDGKNTTGMVVLRPLSLVDEDKARWLEISLMGREGSVGVASVRNHRFGARVATVHPWVHAGTEYLAAWGVDGDSSRTPWALSAWGYVHPPSLPVQGMARFDWVDEVPTADAGARWDLHAAVALAPMRTARAWVGVTHSQAGADAAAVAGAATASTTLYAQIDVRLRGAIPVPVFAEESR